MPVLALHSPPRLPRLLRDQDGTSAVEFAMILPLLVTLFFGSVELLQGLAIDRKVTLTARTVADLVTQATKIDNIGIQNVLEASRGVMTPYPESELTVTVSAVSIDDKGQAKIAWSRSKGKHAKQHTDGDIKLPAGLKTNNTQLIWSEVTYDFKPTVGHFITGTMTLKDQLYMRPRLSEKVDCCT